jgi:hypothetical protein
VQVHIRIYVRVSFHIDIEVEHDETNYEDHPNYILLYSINVSSQLLTFEAGIA